MEQGLARPGSQQALIFYFLDYPLVTASHKGTAAEKLVHLVFHVPLTECYV